MKPIYFTAILYFIFINISFISCTPKNLTPPRSISIMEAQGLLNNDFAVVVSIGISAPSELKGTSIFEIKTNSQILDELKNKNISKSKEIVIFSEDQNNINLVIQTLQKEGYRVGILK